MTMTIDEQIKILESNAEFERKDGDLQGCLNFRQLAEWLKDYKRLLGAIEDIKTELWDSGMNMTGEYQGVWVRYSDIEKAFDKYIQKGEE